MKPCYMDIDGFIINIKTKNFYEDIANDVKKRLNTSNYEVNRPLPTGKNKKVIGLMKDEQGRQVMTQFAVLRPKTYSYLIDDDNSDKKVKRTKKFAIERILKFTHCLLKNEIILNSQQIFKSEAYNVYTEEINKIALSSNDDKRLQTYDRITTCPYILLIITLMKIKQNIIQSGHIFKIIHVEYSLQVVLEQQKKNPLLNLINNQPDINKIYLHAKDPYEAKYQCLIDIREKARLSYYDDPKAFMEYSNDMSDVYKNIEEYNPGKKT